VRVGVARMAGQRVRASPGDRHARVADALEHRALDLSRQGASAPGQSETGTRAWWNTGKMWVGVSASYSSACFHSAALPQQRRPSVMRRKTRPIETRTRTTFLGAPQTDR
jgi:hypothetical protein